jgi:hypothetical protein
MTALQTTETVFKLFFWKSGTYAFEPGDVEWDPETVAPLRAESVLMEGFRQVDEWPLIRKKIPSTALTFERVKALEPERPRGAGDAGVGDEVDAAFDAMGREASSHADAAVGPGERTVYELAVPERPVERIVDLSRLGEFETCKALFNLINLGYLRTAAVRERTGVVGAYARDWQQRLRAGAARALATLAVAAALAGLAVWLDEAGGSEGGRGGAAAVDDNTVQRFVARAQLARLRGALEVYRLEKGGYPERLEELVEAGLASARDLRYPWRAPYHYRRPDQGRYVLLSPVE